MNPLATQGSPPWHTYRRQLQQRPARDTQPWTTTRCHRLLRPLKTHIFALRREVEQESAELLSDDASGEGNSGAIIASTSNRGKIQHTYSRRGRKPAPSHTVQPRESPPDGRVSKTMKMSSRKALQPGEIVLPTPVIRRVRQQSPSPLRQADKRSHCTTLHLPGSLSGFKPKSMVSALESELLPLRHSLSSARFSLYESILRALHALLIATAAPSPTNYSSTTSARATTNTKSLMAMCLRKVPEYIGELEYWEQRDAEEKGTKSTLQSSQVSNEVYEAVEDMLPSGRGCSQLRTIVREHGMRVVRDAVVEGLLTDHFALLLVALCFKTKAYLEAEGLLEVILDRSYPKPKSFDSTFDERRKLAPLKTLRDLARGSGRPQFMLRQISRLMKLGKLPLNWLSTKEFASIWSGVGKTLSGDAVCDDTVSFAVHMITLLSSQAKASAFTLRPEKGNLKNLSQQTLISAITALASLSHLRQSARAGSTHYSACKKACAILKRIEYIIKACIYEVKRAGKSGWISTVLNLSAYFTDVTQTASAIDVSEQWHRVLQHCNKRGGKQHYEAAMTFLCSLAQRCGQGAAEPSNFYLTNFCDQLDNMAPVVDGKSRQIRTDCAFFLAERTNDMRDLAFAESFHDNTGSPDNDTVNCTSKKSSSTNVVTGFRWDGDISEWVTATPAQQSRRLPSQTQESSRESPEETCQDETGDDSGVSDFEASLAKRHGSYKRLPERWTRSSATHASHCAQQQGSSATEPSARTRKRNAAVAGLLSLQPSDDEEEEEEEEDGGLPPPQSSHQRRASGQENRIGVVSATNSKRRRRVRDATILKPRRAILRTITNTGHEDLSDDELGL